MNLNIIFQTIGFIFSLIGVVAAFLFFKDRYFPTRRISWKYACKAAKKIANKLVSDNFSPTLIFGIGRGGAIMGSLISGCLGHRPIVMIDRKYIWEKGDRVEDLIFPVNIPSKYLKNVLLVAGEVHSGNTMKIYSDYLERSGVKNIRRATLFYETGSTAMVEYKGLESSKKNIKMPWMFSKNYIRADRGPTTEFQQDSDSK